jgi:hypothetical protein
MSYERGVESELLLPEAAMPAPFAVVAEVRDGATPRVQRTP